MISGIILSTLGAVIAAALGGIGSTLGVSKTSSTGAGLVAEDGEQFGNILLLSALPGSQAVYGLLVAILTLQNTGLLSGVAKVVSFEQGMMLLLAGIPVGLTCLLSGTYQGKVLASGIQMIAKDKSKVGQVIIMGALVETFAVFGLLVSLLMINGIQIA
jgi:V/A-type H+-transporting ATPase subunit K